MMKKIIPLTLTIIFSYTVLVGQDYSGISKRNYQVLLQINKDSSIQFIYNLNQKLYAEYIGTIKKLNDSLFHISARMELGNDLIYCPYFGTIDSPVIFNDTDYFYVDTPFVKLTDTVIIKYSNGQTAYYRPYDNQGKETNFILNKKLFNRSKRSNYYLVILRACFEIK